MKASQRHVIDYLKAMSPEDVADIVFSTEVTKILQERTHQFRTNTPDRQKLTNAVFQQKVLVKTPKKQTIAEREQKVAVWAKAHLKPYNLVRMNGTRDGHGLRLVIEIKGDQVVCQRFNKISSADVARFAAGQVVKVQEGADIGYYVKTRDYSTHQLGKVQSRFIRYANSDVCDSYDVISGL